MNYKNRPKKYVILQVWIFTALGEIGLMIKGYKIKFSGVIKIFCLTLYDGYMYTIDKSHWTEHFLKWSKAIFIHVWHGCE